MNEREIKPLSSEFSPEESELARQLLSLRQPPRLALQQRIQAIPQQPAPLARVIPRHLLGGLATLILLALLFISSPVQATLDEVQKVVGQIHLAIRSFWPEPAETVVLLETEPMSLAAAQAVLPFNFAVPVSIPSGLTRASDEVGVTQSPVPLVKMEWRDVEDGFVQLTAYAANQENQLTQTLVGPDSSETIQVNGQAALLVYGGWDGTRRTWDHQSQIITLIWTVDGVRYRLLAYSKAVSLVELLAMAESIH